MWKKLKSFLSNDTVFTLVLILLVGISSFALGRLSVENEGTQVAGVKAFQVLPSLPEPVSNAADQVQVVASRSGTKYHLPDCPGAKQMKPENRIEFNSVIAAQAAGYAPAGNCPGL